MLAALAAILGNARPRTAPQAEAAMVRAESDAGGAADSLEDVGTGNRAVVETLQHDQAQGATRGRGGLSDGDDGSASACPRGQQAAEGR